MSCCKLCGKPIGLIHHCKVSPPGVEKKPLIERAREALMMADAGYDVPLLLIELARAHLESHPDE